MVDHIEIIIDSSSDMIMPDPIPKDKNLKEGYDVERFIQPPRQEFKCPVCLGVVRLPKECQRCGTLICNKCEIGCRKPAFSFEASLAVPHELSCPICRATTPFRTPSKVLLNVINNLELRCTNFQSGCSAVKTMEHMKYHESECELKTLKCANKELCQKRGTPHNFVKVPVPDCILERPQFKKYRQKGIYACGQVCSKVALMGIYLDVNDRDAVVKMYEEAVDHYESKNQE